MNTMKKKDSITGLLFFALSVVAPLLGARPSALVPARPPFLLAAEESQQEEGPSEAVIRKLAAMMPEQNFKRGEKQVSKGGAAPEGTTVYPVQILNSDGTVAFDANFFQEASGKWALFDNFGNVAHLTD
jgi:hypothetical protein